MFISCWHSCFLQHGRDEAFETKVQVLQVTRNNPSGKTEKLHSQKTVK